MVTIIILIIFGEVMQNVCEQKTVSNLGIFQHEGKFLESEGQITSGK